MLEPCERLLCSGMHPHTVYICLVAIHSSSFSKLLFCFPAYVVKVYWVYNCSAFVCILILLSDIFTLVLPFASLRDQKRRENRQPVRCKQLYGKFVGIMEPWSCLLIFFVSSNNLLYLK